MRVNGINLIINSTLSDLKNRANKNARLYDNQTPVVSNSYISERNEKAGANPVNHVVGRTGFYRHKLKAFFCAAFS